MPAGLFRKSRKNCSKYSRFFFNAISIYRLLLQSLRRINSAPAGFRFFLKNATPQETSVSEDLHFVCESKLLYKAVCLQTAVKISHAILVANFKRFLKKPSRLLQSLTRWRKKYFFQENKKIPGKFLYSSGIFILNIQFKSFIFLP